MKIYTKNESRKLKLNEKNIIINPTKSVNTILAESITLSSSTVEVTNLGSTKLTSILTPVGANENIIWTSSDPSIISVNNNGLLTLVGSSGSVTITATTEKTKLSATCEAEVCIYPDSIKISTNSIEINTNYSDKITAGVYPANANNRDVRWASLDTSIVTASGAVTGCTLVGISEGTAIVTAQAKGNANVMATCEVTVTEAVIETLSLSKTEISLYETSSVSIDIQMTPSKVSYKACEWIVENPSIAEITDMGAIFGLSQGETTITCRHIRSGKTATCKVTVNSLPENIIQVNNVSSLKTTSLSIGDVVQTSCYSTNGDGGEAIYLIESYDYWLNSWLPIDARRMSTKYDKLGVNLLLTDSVVDEYGCHTLNNGLVACLLNRLDVKVEQYGCVGDGVTDNSEQFIHLFGQNKHGKITFGLNKVYMFPERSDKNRDTTIFEAVTNPYAAYSAGRSTTCARIVISSVNELEIDGNGSTIKIPDGQWKVKQNTQDFGTINMYRTIRNLKIHDLIFDNSGLTMGYDTFGVENHGIAWKTGNISCSDGETPIACDGVIHELSNFEVYNCTFKDLGTAKAIGDCGGDAVLIINPDSNSHDIHFYNNKVYNWGRWVFAIDLGGEGECIENVSFNNNECIQYADNVSLAGKARGLGWIDFEARKCFKNLEVNYNYISGANGWAFNGNNKISENISIIGNTIIVPNYTWQSKYPYMFNFYYVQAKNVVFKDNDLTLATGTNRLGNTIYNLQVENNKFASSSTISLYKPFGNIIIKNNTKEGKGIIAGISLLGELPDTLNEYDKNNPWCNITFKDNEGGFSGNVFDANIPKRYSYINFDISGNTCSKFNLIAWDALGKFTFDPSQINSDATAFSCRGAIFTSKSTYNYAKRINGGGIYKAGDLIAEDDKQKTICISEGYVQMQGSADVISDCPLAVDRKVSTGTPVYSSTELYVACNDGTLTGNIENIDGEIYSGNVKLTYITNVAQTEVVMK